MNKLRFMCFTFQGCWMAEAWDGDLYAACGFGKTQEEAIKDAELKASINYPYRKRNGNDCNLSM